MSKKILLKKPLFHISVAGIIILTGIIFLLLNKNNQPVPTAEALFPDTAENNVFLTEKTNTNLPTHLRIPKIGVDARIEHVGLTSAGAMDAPKGPGTVAWFRLGPRPGEIGSAVLAGHEGWRDGIPAVFDSLHMLNRGDKIFVTDEKGATVIFTVREIKIYSELDDASAVFASEDAVAHLNLVTCHGIWNKKNKSYANRLVVFTDKEI